MSKRIAAALGTLVSALRIALGWAVVAASARGGDSPVVDRLALREHEALAAAIEQVAPSVVQIRTVGGLERVDETTLAQGPTTGLIVSRDGYIVSSAFNFAQQPSSILVRLPDGSQRAAELVGRDDNRMLVLLKVQADEPLPVPQATPLSEVRVGQRVAAVGRTFVAHRVNVSSGVISAKGRMYGRVIQTDAEASAANYGGPLVDLSGRVLGVLAPMAPQASGATEEPSAVAGVEYYDSGIAFAAPLEHVLAVLPRWIEQGDLHRGLLGVGLQAGSPHASEPRITSVWPRSPAADAGWAAGDLITAVDGRPVVSQTQLRMQIVPHYAGDTVSVTLRRGKGDEAEEIDSQLTLAAKLPAYQQAFLGILPQRSWASSAKDAGEDAAEGDAERSTENRQGVAIRAVWPDSPAAEAPLQAGDLLTKIGEQRVTSADDAAKALAAHTAGDEVTIAVVSDGEESELTLTADLLPTEILDADDLPSDAANFKQSQGDDHRAIDELKLPEFSQTARVLAPSGKVESPALVLWLGGRDAKASEELARAWAANFEGDRVVLVVAEPADETGWAGGDLEYLAKLLSSASGAYGADPRRTIVAGEGKAGQLALAFAMKARGQLAGVAAVAAPLPRTLTLPDNAPGASLSVLMVGTQNSPFSVLVDRDARRMLEAGYPVSEATRTAGSSRDGMLDAATRRTIARWLDGLDRF